MWDLLASDHPATDNGSINRHKINLNVIWCGPCGFAENDIGYTLDPTEDSGSATPDEGQHPATPSQAARQRRWRVASATSGRAARREADLDHLRAGPHHPGVWVSARVDRQWRYQGFWKVAVYYYVDMLQYFRVLPADDCRPHSA